MRVKREKQCKVSRTETSFRNWTRLHKKGGKKEAAAAGTVHSRSTVRVGRSTGERGKRNRSQNKSTVVIPSCSEDGLFGSWPNNLVLIDFLEASAYAAKLLYTLLEPLPGSFNIQKVMSFLSFTLSCRHKYPSCSRTRGTPVESPDQFPPGHFSHLETPLGSTRTVQSRLSIIHRKLEVPHHQQIVVDQISGLQRLEYIHVFVMLTVIRSAASSLIVAKYDVVLV